MGVPIREQLLVLSAGVITGGGLGLIRHGLRAAERHLPGTVGVLLDVLFLMLAGGWLFRLGLETGEGMRLYLLFSVFLGWMAYRRGLESTVSGMARLPGEFLRWMLSRQKK